MRVVRVNVALSGTFLEDRIGLYLRSQLFQLVRPPRFFSSFRGRTPADDLGNLRDRYSRVQHSGNGSVSQVMEAAGQRLYLFALATVSPVSSASSCPARIFAALSFAASLASLMSPIGSVGSTW
jgi:hypothetical protein